MATYRIKAERNRDGSFLVGVGVTDDPAAATDPKVPMKTFIWKTYPAGTAPTKAQIKADFNVDKKDGQGVDIPNSSMKDQLDQQLAAQAPGLAADVTPAQNEVTFP